MIHNAPSPRRHRPLGDTFFARDPGELTPAEQVQWEPTRRRLVREGWLISGAMGMLVGVVRTVLPIIANVDLHFSLASVARIAVWTTTAGCVAAFGLVRPRVIRKRDDFMRSARLREAMFQDDGCPID